MPAVLRDPNYLHPVMRENVRRIHKYLIEHHKAPFRVFETARTQQRQMALIEKGKAKTFVSRYVFDLNTDPPLYSTAVNFVYYTNRWSWDLRDMTIKRWYQLFGEMVLDLCPDLDWAGRWRKNEDYTHYELSDAVCTREGIEIPRGAGPKPEIG